VVVVASVARNRSSLAIGNVVGSAISNILGAFSLGLLFNPSSSPIVFDRSSKIYSLLLLLLTTFVTAITLRGTRGSWKIFGSILLALFVLYVVSVAWAIGRGVIAAPQLSDSDDDDSSQDSDNATDVPRHSNADVAIARPASQDDESGRATSPLLARTDSTSDAGLLPHTPRRPIHSLAYHIGFLLLGFISICLSGYVLSHASTTISDEAGISDVFFGVVILSIATTLPEKFIAVLSGVRGHAGILVANTVGSNIFLLTLCMGVVLVVTAGGFDAGSVNGAELGVMMGSTLALTATVWFGAKWSRWIGAVMLAGYIVFLVLELTLIRRVD